MADTRTEMLRERLMRALSPTHIDITDESARHAGHAGAASGGGHFIVHIVAEAFHKKTLIQRHRLVYDAVGDMMHSEIHALSIEAKTPYEV